MNIQSLSVCVPALKCINDCKFCCSKMHTSDYEDRFSDLNTFSDYIKDLRKRMEYARQNGCNTCMLTGNNEPQQNKEFLKVFSQVNESLDNPFLNIEIQTSGAFVTPYMLEFLKNSIGVTTVAISVACLDDDEKNIELTGNADKNLNLKNLCKEIKKRNMNLRICLNMNDYILNNYTNKDKKSKRERIIDICKELEADQITFRALWSPDKYSVQGRWINDNVTERTYSLIESLKEDIKKNGKYLDTLEYGSDRYDYYDFSVVIDEDSMSKGENKQAVKYLILRPNGHLYSKWDSKASLIF